MLVVQGRGAYGQLQFGSQRPGSSSPLLFELTEKHLKDCEWGWGRGLGRGGGGCCHYLSGRRGGQTRYGFSAIWPSSIAQVNGEAQAFK